MELRHLRYFLAVVEEGHFGRAARSLRIAQPPLSRQIQALERELGFALFERTRRRVAVTAAGQVFARHVRGVFEALELGVREARRAASGETGRIVIGYPSSVAASGLTELLRAFRQRAPDVEVVLREMAPQTQIDALKEGTLDVGFVRAPLEEPSLASEVVRKEELVVALAADHRLAKRRRIDLAELAHDPFVCFPRARGPSFFDQLMRLCHEAGFTPRIVQEAAQLDVVSFVAAGFGVAIVPASVQNLRRPGVVFRAIDGSPKTELLAAWRPDNRSPIVGGFLEVVRRVGVRSGRRAAADVRTEPSG